MPEEPEIDADQLNERIHGGTSSARAAHCQRSKRDWFWSRTLCRTRVFQLVLFSRRRRPPSFAYDISRASRLRKKSFLTLKHVATMSLPTRQCIYSSRGPSFSAPC